MALFRSSKRNVFQPAAYGSSRRRRRVPRWLVLILTGIVLGAGGVLFLQKSYGPTLLTVEQSEQLHHDLNSLNLDKQRLQSQLSQQTHDAKEAVAALSSQKTELEQAQEQITKLKGDLLLLADAIPPDPRGTSPGIRAAEFNNDAGQLNYQILVMQDKANAPVFTGEMELLVAGRYPNGNTNTIALPLIDIKVGHYDHIQGIAALPAAFTARLVTVRITDSATKKLRATRTIHVR